VVLLGPLPEKHRVFRFLVAGFSVFSVATQRSSAFFTSDKYPLSLVACPFELGPERGVYNQLHCKFSRGCSSPPISFPPSLTTSPSCDLRGYRSEDLCVTFLSSSNLVTSGSDCLEDPRPPRGVSLSAFSLPIQIFGGSPFPFSILSPRSVQYVRRLCQACCTVATDGATREELPCRRQAYEPSRSSYLSFITCRDWLKVPSASGTEPFRADRISVACSIFRPTFTRS